MMGRAKIIFICISLVIFASTIGCSEQSNTEINSTWDKLPIEVRQEFYRMLKDTSDEFIRCKNLNKGECDIKSVWYKRGSLNFKNGKIEITKDVTETSLRFFIFYGDTLYMPIKKSSYLKKMGNSLEKIIKLDTLEFKKIINKHK
ncbi:hypothetical protein [Aequorivita antarctica]|uniref:Lipocalin family protein n=1 Tax=Aequorivita antarctica TaxID=153266 RepID=A0A5C6YVI8_9FLAO|nr:hypothetical protein [Aequorivita antarctica]TXD71590.1 hypothetical protein ESU54_16335 [Aequorivita antarctica]SRX75265.1 hypothetical protein AEQU3_02259 [Aequorivita antarctica]